MATPSLDIRYVARLARLELTAEEETRFAGQLGSVLEYFEKLKQVDVSQAEPMAHAMPLVNVARPDAARPSLPHEAALRNAPASGAGLFNVPKIVE